MSYACSTFVVYILHLIAELDESSACDVPTGALCDHIGEGLELVDTNGNQPVIPVPCAIAMVFTLGLLDGIIAGGNAEREPSLLLACRRC